MQIVVAKCNHFFLLFFQILFCICFRSPTEGKPNIGKGSAFHPIELKRPKLAPVSYLNIILFLSSSLFTLYSIAISFVYMIRSLFILYAHGLSLECHNKQTDKQTHPCSVLVNLFDWPSSLISYIQKREAQLTLTLSMYSSCDKWRLVRKSSRIIISVVVWVPILVGAGVRNPPSVTVTE